MIVMNKGVENALKMREMFISEGYRVSTDIGYNQIGKTVARIWIRKYQFFRGYYFYEDGTYFNGAN